MTISTNDLREEYTATAGQTVFTFDFRVFADTDVKVYQTASGSDFNDLSDIITAYSVSRNANQDSSPGGSITLDSGATAGDRITIVSNVPETRTTDYQTGGEFDPDTVDDDLDRVLTIAKQASAKADRALLFPESVQSAKSLTLPTPSPGNYLRWNTDGDGLENTSNITNDAQETTTHRVRLEYTDGASGVGLSGSSIADIKGAAVITGDIVQTEHSDSDKKSLSGFSFQATGNNIPANSGDVSGDDGYYYDSDGAQFEKVTDWYGYNINETTFVAALTANQNGFNYGKQVYLFGDSHGWGQGSPEVDDYADGDFSAHSASLFNKGFMARIKSFIEWKLDIDDKMYTCLGAVPNRRFLPHEEMSQGFPAREMNKLWRGITVLNGRVLTDSLTYSAAGSTHKSWFDSFANNDSDITAFYRDKTFQGRFAKSCFRIYPGEDVNTFHEAGKHEYFTLLPLPGLSPAGGFTQVEDTNGNIIAEYDGSEFYVHVSAKTPRSDLGMLLANDEPYFIPGYGTVYFGTSSAVSGGGRWRVYAADGSSYPTGLNAYLYANMKIYREDYVGTTLVRVDPEKPFRKLYIAFRFGPNARKIKLSLQSSALLNGNWQPYGKTSGLALHDLVPQWNFGQTGFPTVKIISGTRSHVNGASPQVVIGASDIQFDSYSASVGDVVYEIDFGSLVHSPVFLRDAGASATAASTDTYTIVRGLLFNGSGVFNWSLGGHTIDQWLGDAASYNDTAHDHVQDIVDYSQMRPYLVCIQLPLVNEYLRQTSIATFKAKLAQLMSELAAIPISGGSGGAGPDFLMFSTLGEQDIEFEGAATDPIIYDDYVQAAKEVCYADGAGFVDCRKMLIDLVSKREISYQKLYSNNGHPSSVANELMANKIISILHRVL